MRLKSAIEDFEANTLGAVPGLLGRLSYVGRLRDGNATGNGRYEHWGLAKVYGDDAAQFAIRASHRALALRGLEETLGCAAQRRARVVLERASNGKGVPGFAGALST